MRLRDLERTRKEELDGTYKESEGRTSLVLQQNRDIQILTERAMKLEATVKERTQWALRLDTELEERTAWALQLERELRALQQDCELRARQPNLPRALIRIAAAMKRIGRGSR
jgi:hypothetical protein